MAEEIIEQGYRELADTILNHNPGVDLGRVRAAFELADFGCWRRIIESVVYEGLYAVGNAVLNGTFRKYTRNRERQRKGRTQ